MTYITHRALTETHIIPGVGIHPFLEDQRERIHIPLGLSAHTGVVQRPVAHLNTPETSIVIKSCSAALTN